MRDNFMVISSRAILPLFSSKFNHSPLYFGGGLRRDPRGPLYGAQSCEAARPRAGQPSLVLKTKALGGSFEHFTGLSPSLAVLFSTFKFSSGLNARNLLGNTLRYPLSLATTYGISVDFFSFGYLDVSVHPVFTACICFFMGV